MALKTLMLKKSITDYRSNLSALEAKDTEFETRSREIEQSIEEAKTEEERSAVNAAIDSFEAERKENEENKQVLREKIDALEAELKGLEEKQEKEKEPEERKDNKPMNNPEMDTARAERAAFVDYLRTGRIEKRDDYNMQKSNNGAIVPKTIAQTVVSKIANIAPIYEKATKYSVKGTLDIPVYPASSSHVIAAAYGTEFTDLEASSGDFTSVSLTGYPVGALAKISKSLINNAEVDPVPFVEEEMAKAFAAFLSDECINGTDAKIVGLSGIGAGMTVTGTALTYVTADDLIDVQEKVADAHQANACWIMAPATKAAIRKLKDADGNYLLVRDFANMGTPYSLLGKPVYVDDNCPALGTASNMAIIYGDLSCLAIKFSEDLDIEVLRERYAPQHAIGVVAWAEVDAKIADASGLSCLKCNSADPEPEEEEEEVGGGGVG